MIRIHLLTSIAVVFVLTGLLLIPSPYPVLSLFYFLVAYFLSLKEVAKYTSVFQFATLYIACLAFGARLDDTFVYFPFFTASFLLVATGSVARMMYFRTFGYTGYSWFEPLMLFLSITLWVGGNVVSAPGLIAWILPIPVFVFQGILALGIWKDKIQLLNFTKGGYKIAIGTEAPDFSLPDQNGKFVELSSFRGHRHLLLIFVRGDWCPGCHMMLRTYQKEAEKFKTKNIYAIAIGPDPIGVNREMVLKLGLDFEVLSDEKQKTAMVYGVQLDKYDNDFAEKYEEGIPLPASFLIDKRGIVQYVSRPDKVGEFLDPRTIFPIIDKLTP